jgi:hypothetical protein
MTLRASQSNITHIFYGNHLYVETDPIMKIQEDKSFLRFNKILRRFNSRKVDVFELGQAVEVLVFYMWMMRDG